MRRRVRVVWIQCFRTAPATGLKLIPYYQGGGRAELAIRQKTECISPDLIEQAAANGTYKYLPQDARLRSLVVMCFS